MYMKFTFVYFQVRDRIREKLLASSDWSAGAAMLQDQRQRTNSSLLADHVHDMMAKVEQITT